MARHPERSVSRGRPASSRASVLAMVAICLAMTLTACSAPATPAVSGSSAVATSPSAPTPSPTPTNTSPPAPVLVPDGTAEENLPLFAAVTAAVWNSAHRAFGRSYIDNLVKAGFKKSDMQVTEDESTVGNPAESIQFSVRWGDECLVGQVGPTTGRPVTVVVPALTGGACLVGRTRPIDW